MTAASSQRGNAHTPREDGTAALEWPLWRTQARIVVTEPGMLAVAHRIVLDHLAAVEKACSRFRSDSEITALARRHGEPTEVSLLLAEFLRVALCAADRSHGDVDPTVGAALVDLGYDRDFPLIDDTPTSVHAVLRRPANWTMLSLRDRTVTVPDGIQLDLGVTAKALSADQCAHRVGERLGCGVLISLGGDIATTGAAGRPRRSGPHPRRLARATGAGRLMTQASLEQALWALGRGAGVSALALITISVITGIVTRSGRPLVTLPRFGVTELHRTTALLGTGLVGLHLLTLLANPYAQLRLVDFVVPFLGAYRPIWLGLGTLAVDLLLVILATSLLRHRLGLRAFQVVHWATYGLWPVALAHGLGNGTDAGHLWFLILAATCALAVLVALAWRLSRDFVEYDAARTRGQLTGRS